MVLAGTTSWKLLGMYATCLPEGELWLNRAQPTLSTVLSLSLDVRHKMDDSWEGEGLSLTSE